MEARKQSEVTNEHHLSARSLAKLANSLSLSLSSSLLSLLLLLATLDFIFLLDSLVSLFLFSVRPFLTRIAHTNGAKEWDRETEKQRARERYLKLEICLHESNPCVFSSFLFSFFRSLYVSQSRTHLKICASMSVSVGNCDKHNWQRVQCFCSFALFT